MTPRIVIVGGGPAGLAAAASAGRTGAMVLLLEERSETGGQLRYRAQPVAEIAGGGADSPQQIAARLRTTAAAAGAEIRTSAVVAGWFAGNELLVVEAGGARRMVADALIVATGSVDLPFPFPGATFPGVFSARGLQTMLHLHRVRPGRRFAVIGGGDVAEEIVNDVVQAGGEVVWSGIAPSSFLRAEGSDGVTAIVVGRERHAVDAIAIAAGRQPDTALAAMAGVPVGFAAELGGYVPRVDDCLAAGSGLFVAGDAAGVGSVAAAIAEGRLAGLAAARSIGLADDGQVDAALAGRGAEIRWRAAVRASMAPVFSQPYE